jgi:DNA-directed RNA polymerase subunit RPC12/RpoP
MGWNCTACGELLSPMEPIGTDRFVLVDSKARVLRCKKCNSRYLIIEGVQPRIYLNSVVICVDDGENK